MKKTWKKGDKFKVIQKFKGSLKPPSIITAKQASSKIGYDFIDEETNSCWKIGTQVIPYPEKSKKYNWDKVVKLVDSKSKNNSKKILSKLEETTKFDEGKPDFTQIPQEALLEVAKSFTYGATKYGQFNYSLGTDYRRYVAASQRHINQWLRGEDIDESGTNHLSNAIASLMMVLDNQLTGKGKDDRNKVYKNK